jgi:hypothetical protein
MLICSIEQIFKEVFDEDKGLVKSVESVYEKSEDGEYLKLVISIHNIKTDISTIIHTKFIFKTDLEKIDILENSFIYLYDINCRYRKVDFNDENSLKESIDDIISSTDFGKDIKILSDFIEAPSMFLNYYFKKSNITNYSVFDVQYEPKFKIQPCDKTTFDFKVNVNNSYDIEISISKIEDDEKISYKVYTKFLDDYIIEEIDTLNNVQNIIGTSITSILDKRLK